MNPLLNPILLFELGVMLMISALAICNWESVKAGLSNFWQWCRRSDYMDVIAVLMVITILVLVNWAGYSL
jgi:ABC-type sulfate transport system permease subunit